MVFYSSLSCLYILYIFIDIYIFIEVVGKAKADLYLTGEMRHHDALAAVEKGTAGTVNLSAIFYLQSTTTTNKNPSNEYSNLPSFPFPLSSSLPLSLILSLSLQLFSANIPILNEDSSKFLNRSWKNYSKGATSISQYPKLMQILS